jgi:HlyD family secretion protein
VNENDIVRVELNDTALIEVDAYPDTRFSGIVSEIPVSANTTGVTTDQVTNFMVKIFILPESYAEKASPANPFPLRPGMSATADIITERKNGIYTIPIQSVTTRVDTAGTSDRSDIAEGGMAQVSSDGSVSSTDAPGGGDARSDEPLVVVFTVSDGKAHMKQVQTGIQDNSYIQVTGGLDPEDEVVIAPYSAISRQLKDEMEVEVVPEEELFKDD